MKRIRTAHVGLGALLTVLGCMIVLVEPAIRRDDALEAAEWQFLLDSEVGPTCQDCCWTGFCCTIPMVCS